MQRAEGFFLETSFLLVEGMYTSNHTFLVNLVAHPPSESRETSLKTSAVANINFWGLSNTSEDHDTLLLMEKAHDEVFFVILSDVWLDHPKVIPFP